MTSQFSFPFLKISYNGQSAALSQADCALPNEIYGVVTNPAALGACTSKQLFLTYNPIILDIAAGALAMAVPHQRWGVFCPQLLFISYGNFEPLDIQNKPIEGMLNPYSMVLGISWAQQHIKFPLLYGATFRILYDQICEGIASEIPSYVSYGFSFDAGMHYKALGSRLIYGILLKNIGVAVSHSSVQSSKNISLPFSAASGISYVYKNNPQIRSSFEIEKPIDDFLIYKTGIEIATLRNILFVRGGYTFNQKDLNAFLSAIRDFSFDQEYTKSNWSLLSCGLGLVVNGQNSTYFVDTALILKTLGISPEFMLSLRMEF